MGGLGSKKKCELITCGLDNSGKSTIINYLKPPKMREEQLSATIGYQVENFTVKVYSQGNVNFKVFDMGGAKKFRNLWEHYYHDVQGVVFVIDTADKIRLCLVKDELEMIISNKDLKGVPILFFANKMDIPGAMAPPEVAEQLDLAEMCDGRQYRIVPSNALTGDGVDEGVAWLAETVLREQH